METKLSDFDITKLLGKGSYGEVYKVRRKSDGQIYALKRVNISSMSDKEKGDALNEVRLLASVRHINIISFLEAFVDGRDLCLVLEYANKDLSVEIEKHRKKRQYMPESQIWDYFTQICRGLKCLENARILHRDLKPQNLLITSDGVVKLCDFNVSKLMKGGFLHTQLGTPYYLSPEIWRNRPYNIKSDIWSLGCILYEMAALQPPFHGKDFDQLSRKVQSGLYPAIPSVYSRDLADVIGRLLSVSPHNRPSLDEILAHRKVQRRTDPESEGAEIELLDTIKPARNVRQLTRNLPRPRYAESRVASSRIYNSVVDTPMAQPTDAPKDIRSRVPHSRLDLSRIIEDVSSQPSNKQSSNNERRGEKQVRRERQGERQGERRNERPVQDQNPLRLPRLSNDVEERVSLVKRVEPRRNSIYSRVEESRMKTPRVVPTPIVSTHHHSAFPSNPTDKHSVLPSISKPPKAQPLPPARPVIARNYRGYCPPSWLG